MNTPIEPKPDHEQIARLAYLAWEQKGCPKGADLECWLEAEKRVMSSKPRSDIQPFKESSDREGRNMGVRR